VPEQWSLAWKVLVASAIVPPLVGLLVGAPIALAIGSRQRARRYACPSCQHRWSEAIPGRGNPGL